MSAVMHPYGGSPENRNFHYAIAVSVAIHAVLLFAVPGLRESRSAVDTSGVLVARIAQPEAAPAQAPPQKEPPAPKVEPPRPVAEPPPEPPRLRTPSPIAQPEPAPPPKAAPRPAVEAAPPAAAASVPGAIARFESQPGPAGDLDLGSLKNYEAALSLQASRFKVYPRVAIDNNWEGDVEVIMVIGANGILRSISVRTSSGREVLDQEAMDMFRKAKPRVEIPPALKGKEFTVVRWVSFGLKAGG